MRIVHTASGKTLVTISRKELQMIQSEADYRNLWNGVKNNVPDIEELQKSIDLAKSVIDNPNSPPKTKAWYESDLNRLTQKMQQVKQLEQLNQEINMTNSALKAAKPDSASYNYFQKQLKALQKKQMDAMHIVSQPTDPLLQKKTIQDSDVSQWEEARRKFYDQQRENQSKYNVEISKTFSEEHKARQEWERQKEERMRAEHREILDTAKKDQQMEQDRLTRQRIEDNIKADQNNPVAPQDGSWLWGFKPVIPEPQSSPSPATHESPKRPKRYKRMEDFI